MVRFDIVELIIFFGGDEFVCLVIIRMLSVTYNVGGKLIVDRALTTKFGGKIEKKFFEEKSPHEIVKGDFVLQP